MQPVKERSHRIRKARRISRALPLALATAALLNTQCKQPEPASQGLSEHSCRSVIRRPREQEIVTVGPEGLLPERLSCFGRSTCFGASDRAEALPAKPGVYEVRAGGPVRQHQANDAIPMPLGVPVRGLFLSDTAALLASEAGLEVIDLETGKAERFLAPAFAPNEQLVGVSLIEGGVGYSVGRMDDPCAPSELRWLRPPAGVSELPKGAHVVHDEGKLVGWVEERAGRWELVRHPSRERLPLPGSFAEVHGVQPLDGFWLATFEEEAVVFDEQGRSRRFAIGPTRHLRLLEKRAFLVDEERGVFRIGLERDTPVSLFDAKKDLGGAPLPPGARRERLQAADDGDRRMLLIERVRLPSCRAEDRVHLLDVDERSWRTLVSDDRVRMHPTWTPGGFRFVEGSSEYTFVALGED